MRFFIQVPNKTHLTHKWLENHEECLLFQDFPGLPIKPTNHPPTRRLKDILGVRGFGADGLRFWPLRWGFLPLVLEAPNKEKLRQSKGCGPLNVFKLLALKKHGTFEKRVLVLVVCSAQYFLSFGIFCLSLKGVLVKKVLRKAPPRCFQTHLPCLALIELHDARPKSQGQQPKGRHQGLQVPGLQIPSIRRLSTFLESILKP